MRRASALLISFLILTSGWAWAREIKEIREEVSQVEKSLREARWKAQRQLGLYKLLGDTSRKASALRQKVERKFRADPKRVAMSEVAAQAERARVEAEEAVRRQDPAYAAVVEKIEAARKVIEEKQQELRELMKAVRDLNRKLASTVTADEKVRAVRDAAGKSRRAVYEAYREIENSEEVKVEREVVVAARKAQTEKRAEAEKTPAVAKLKTKLEALRTELAEAEVEEAKKKAPPFEEKAAPEARPAPVD